MDSVSLGSLKDEQAFWAKEAKAWNWRNVIYWILSAAVLLPPAILLTYYLARLIPSSGAIVFGIFIFVTAFYLIAMLFPMGFSYLWINLIAAERFDKVADRWMSVYDKLFAINALSTSSRLKYNPYFYNVIFFRNSAREMVRVLSSVSLADWSGGVARAKPTLLAASTSSKVVQLIDKHLLIFQRAYSWKWFFIWNSPFLLAAFGGMIAVFVTVSFPSRMAGLILLGLILFYCLLGRLVLLTSKNRRFQRELQDVIGAGYGVSQGAEATPLKRPSLFKGRAFSGLNAAQYVDINFQWRVPITRVAGRNMLNEFRAQVLYFGLPGDQQYSGSF